MKEGKTEKSATNEEAREDIACAEGFLGIGLLRFCQAFHKIELHIFQTILCRSAEECMSHILNIRF